MQRHRRALALAKDLEPNVYDVLAGEATARGGGARPGHPAPRDRAVHPRAGGRHVELPQLGARETRLRDALAPVRERYAFTFLDCPPSLGPLTVNALVAADRVIVPVQTEYFALEGLAGPLDTRRTDPARAPTRA